MPDIKNPPEVDVTTRKSFWEKNPHETTTSIAIIGILLLYLIAYIASPFRITVTTTTTIQGVSIFAVFYLFAQLSERVTEVFSDEVSGKSSTKVDENKTNIDVAKSRIDARIKADSNSYVEDLKKEISTLAQSTDYETQKRAVALWVVASAVGVLLTALSLGFFQLIGLTWMPHVWDSFISGIIIGGGTKPLHDFISYIQTQKG
jgi:ElaB/YqjD/DUF883 family membrane-anchored ribosome-binding protein